MLTVMEMVVMKVIEVYVQVWERIFQALHVIAGNAWHYIFMCTDHTLSSLIMCGIAN